MAVLASPQTTAQRLARLKVLLQGMKAGDFERLAAALISHLLGVEIAIASSGFQHGGDAGPSGRQGRRFRIETKRYANSTSLSHRELLGEIDHALARDPALEAWFLVATRAVPEQLEQDLLRKSDSEGLPVVVIDWKEDGFPALAALCTVAPALVGSMVDAEAGSIASALTGEANGRLKTLARDLQSWQLGFERIRALAQTALNTLWTSRRSAVSSFGQDVAGGATGKTITRTSLHDAFDAWWAGPAASDAPALALGGEGVGKTWAAIHWLIDRADVQPIIVLVPSTAAAAFVDTTATGIKRFLGARLCEIAGSRDPLHWTGRLERLLRRPTDEGPVLTLILDGMNQEPGAPWLAILKGLQGPEFEGRVRTVAITRNLHFTERLGHLRPLVVPPHKIEIGPYDTAPGGELDQRLSLEGLTRADLHPDLVELARTPRLFNLVVRHRERLVDGGQVTVHRLLWEYGRDTLGVREGSLSELDWREWLAGVARDQIEGIRTYSLLTIGERVRRPDLSETEVFRRLSDIVDSGFTAQSASGTFSLAPAMVAHALGAALLVRLGEADTQGRSAGLENTLAEWLDPIAGIDERAEILRAAVSIALEGDPAEQREILGLLVPEWLRSQNLPEAHRDEIMRLATALCDPLLDSVERTWGGMRILAINALRGIDRDDTDRQALIVGRCLLWLRTLSRDVSLPTQYDEEAEAHRSARLIERVGRDADGPLTVLGEPLVFVERSHHDATRTIPSLLEGFPLTPALAVFRAAATFMAIRGREDFWSGLKWLCLLNPVDADQATAALEGEARDIAARTPESGVHRDLGRRIAALLLWLSGDEDLEARAAAEDPGLDRAIDYETEYLAQPGRGFFALERRHAEMVLLDVSIPLLRRVSRIKPFLADPEFVLPPAFVAELRAFVDGYDVSGLDAHFGTTVEDSNWEGLLPVLSRAAPDLLAALTREKLASLPGREDEARRIGLSRSTADFLVVDQMNELALGALAIRGVDTGEGDAEPSPEAEFARSRALLITIARLPASERIPRLLDGGSAIYTDLASVLSPLTPDEVDHLVEQYRDSDKAIELIQLLSLADAPPGRVAWDWLEAVAADAASGGAGSAFRVLYRSDADRFGRVLLARDWSWSADQPTWCNHYGSLAIATAGIGLPFDRTLAQIAPWLVPHAVVLRGGEAADAALAAEVLDGVVLLVGQAVPDLGSDVTISREVRAEDPEAFTLTVREVDLGDPAANLRAAFEQTGRAEARSRAIPTALERLKQAREAGASLYLHDLDANDLVPIVRHVPSAVERWLEGTDEAGRDFKRRARLAEGFYLALCEALLSVRPDDGARLWRALRRVLSTRFIGRGGVEELMLMAFRVPTAPDALRREQLDLNLTHSDQKLLDIAVASRLGDAPDWLDAFIREDETSGVRWREQRGRKLRGFHTASVGLINAPWPEGPDRTLRESREHSALNWRRREAWARHWWNRYWEAGTDDEAFAAWTLLLQTIDRRAHGWLVLPVDAGNRHPRRLSHYELNHDDLVSAMTRSEKKMDGEFLGRATVEGLAPWGTVRNR